MKDPSVSLCLYYLITNTKWNILEKMSQSQYFTNYALQNNDSWQLNKIGRKDGRKGGRKEGKEREEVVSLVK